jgi:hypothetical protein
MAERYRVIIKKDYLHSPQWRAAGRTVAVNVVNQHQALLDGRIGPDQTFEVEIQ